MPEVRIGVDNIINEYLSKGDNAKENANMSFGPSGLLFNIGGEGLRRDNLNRIRKQGFEELADLHEKGGVHIHDLSLGVTTPYCAGLSLQNLLNDGITTSSVVSSPAKHLSAAVNHMVNYIGANANDFAGAQAFNDIDLFLAPYAYKAYLDYKRSGCPRAVAFQLTRKSVYQEIQSFIFHLNYNSRWGNQAPFSNITLSITVPDDMKDQLALVGGKPIQDYFKYTTDGVKVNNHTYNDLQEWQRLIADAVLDTFISGDATGKGFTFPVLTINVTEDFFEHPLFDKVSELANKFGTPFFQNFINGIGGGQKLATSDVRSMCPLHPNTEVFVRSSQGIRCMTLGELYSSYNTKATKYEILNENKEWKSFTPIQVKVYNPLTIELNNGVEVNMDSRHEQIIKRGKHCQNEKLIADELVEGMYVPFSSESIEYRDNNYDCGFVVGAYIGDGSKGESNLVYSLNVETNQWIIEKLTKFFISMGCEISHNVNNKVDNLYIRSNNNTLSKWIEQFIYGKNVYEKRIKNKCFALGTNFIQGVLDGWYATDGGNKGRIYTVSQTLKNDFIKICGYLGIHYNVTNIDERNNRISENSKKLYILKFHKRTSYGSFFFYEDGFYWFKIDSIIPIENERSKYYYCVEIDDNNHLFQLSNGMITHNCRLSLDLSEVASHTGGLFGNGDQTGSIQVITISLPYVVKEMLDQGKTYQDIKNRIFNIMELIKQEQLWKREIVEYYFEMGFFELAKQNFKKGFDTFFTTVGFIGLWEAVEMITEDPKSFLDEGGMKIAQDILTSMKDKCQEFMNETGKLFNLEATPAEGATYKLAKKALKQFPDIKHRGLKKAPYFTNSCHLPVEYQDNLDLIFWTQNKLQTIPTGGTVTHFTTGEEMSLDEIKTAIKTICYSNIPYFSINTVFSICPICGYIKGKHFKCPNKHSDEDLIKLKNTYPQYLLDR